MLDRRRSGTSGYLCGAASGIESQRRCPAYTGVAMADENRHGFIHGGLGRARGEDEGFWLYLWRRFIRAFINVDRRL